MRLKRVWDNYIIVREVQKTANKKIVISAATRDGVKYVNLREFYKNKAGGWTPTQEGISIPLLMPINDCTELLDVFNEMLKGFIEVYSVLETIELANPENAVFKEVKR